MVLGNGSQSAASARLRAGAWLKVIPLVALAFALSGCESSGSPDDQGGGGTSGSGGGSGGTSGSGGSPAGTITLRDENNYVTTSTLTPGEIITAAGEDLVIDWGDLTRDMQCHDTSPSEDIDKVALIRFQNLTNEEAAALLTAGELDMADVSGYMQYDTDGSQITANLSDLSVFGTPVNLDEEYTPSDNRVYMLLWATGTTPGTGARTMTFLKPVAGETNTEVFAEPGCDDNGEGILEFDATLTEPAEAAPGAWTIDWRNVTLDGLGNPLAYGSITSVLIGFYEGMTPADIEANIFDIETMATDLWEAEHGGGKASDLRAAVHRETGDPFTGFEGYPEGTWLLGLMCENCQNPAPLVLSVLEPTAGQ